MSKIGSICTSCGGLKTEVIEKVTLTPEARRDRTFNVFCRCTESEETHGPLTTEEQMCVAEIMELLARRGLHKGNFDELVPQMLRAVCKDEHVDAVEEFIRQFDNIEWNWYPNG